MTHDAQVTGIEPQLHTTAEPAQALLRSQEYGADSDTLLIADWFNAKLAMQFESSCRVRVVRDAILPEIRQVLAEGGFNRVIAVGGCSTLDFARVCARFTIRPFTAIPSILSTACISTDRSVIYPGAIREWPITEATRAPDQIVVSHPLLESGGPEELAKWSLSGVGDLLARIGGLIEERAGKPADLQKIQDLSPNTFDALAWFETEFSRWDRSTIARLGRMLHTASLEATRCVQSGGSAVGGEHDLYYALRTMRGYSRDRQTHGRLVSIGTLLAVHEAANQQPVWSRIEEKLRAAYTRVGLPVTGRDLEEIGVHRGEILAGLRLLNRKPSFLARSFQVKGEALVDSAYYAQVWQ